MLWVLIKSLSKVLLISTHNISSHGEIRKYYNSAFLVEKSTLSGAMQQPTIRSLSFQLDRISCHFSDRQFRNKPMSFYFLLSLGLDTLKLIITLLNDLHAG